MAIVLNDFLILEKIGQDFDELAVMTDMDAYLIRSETDMEIIIADVELTRV